MNKWTKEKPKIPCVFIARNKYNDRWEYELFKIEKAKCEDENSYYLSLLTMWGDEYGDLEEDLLADEYMIIEKFDES